MSLIIPYGVRPIQLRVKDYCESHEATYSDHKCKPCWCGDCGYLRKYEITINHSKWDK